MLRQRWAMRCRCETFRSAWRFTISKCSLVAVAVLCRSAGSQATLMAREAEWAQITLPSGEIRRIPASCRATIGKIGNSDHMNVVIGKAGRNRWKGIRPHVRGTAMNPIDHPHGGGEGRTKGGRHPVSPTGKSAKGGGTRKRRKPSEFGDRASSPFAPLWSDSRFQNSWQALLVPATVHYQTFFVY